MGIKDRSGYGNAWFKNNEVMDQGYTDKYPNNHLKPIYEIRLGEDLIYRMVKLSNLFIKVKGNVTIDLTPFDNLDITHIEWGSADLVGDVYKYNILDITHDYTDKINHTISKTLEFTPTENEETHWFVIRANWEEITGIDNNAFNNITNLVSIYFDNLYNVTTIGDNFLYNNANLKRVRLFNDVRNDNEHKLYHYGLYNLREIGDNFISRNNSLNEINISGLHNLESVGDYCLSNNSALTNCIFETQDKNLGNLAAIGNHLLSGCTSLRQVSMGSLINLEWLGSSLLDGCTSLNRFVVPYRIPPKRPDGDAAELVYGDLAALEYIICSEKYYRSLNPNPDPSILPNYYSTNTYWNSTKLAPGQKTWQIVSEMYDSWQEVANENDDWQDVADIPELNEGG